MAILVTAAYWVLIDYTESYEVEFTFWNIQQHILGVCVAGVSFILDGTSLLLDMACDFVLDVSNFVCFEQLSVLLGRK